MKNTNNLIRYINRKRHAAGYGVHSQFAFELIMDTIHTPYSYYIYKDNKDRLEQAGLNKKTDTEYAELLFRLVNRFNSREILEIGSGLGVNTLYLNKHSKQAIVTCVEIKDEKTKKAQLLLADKLENIIFTNVLTTLESSFNTIIWDLETFPNPKNLVIETIEKAIKPDGFIVLNYINKRKENKEVWKKILQLENLTMSFDLGTVGIGFFKPSVPKLNYDIYF